VVLTRPPGGPEGRGTRGAALIDALIALVVLGLAATAVTGMTRGAADGGRAAALDGRRAELALRTVDRLRSGFLAGASGRFVVPVGGEAFDVRYARRDDVAPGAIELTVGPVTGGQQLRLSPARPAP